MICPSNNLVERLDKAIQSLSEKKNFDQHDVFVAATTPSKSSQIMRILQALNLSHRIEGAN